MPPPRSRSRTAGPAKPATNGDKPQWAHDLGKALADKVVYANDLGAVLGTEPTYEAVNDWMTREHGTVQDLIALAIEPNDLPF